MNFPENWGRGIEKIYSTCRNNGLPLPEYTVNPGDIMIKFTGPEDKVVRTGRRVNDRVNDRVNEKERMLLELLTEDPGYTITQLSEKLGISRKTIATRLKKMKENGLIERIGSDHKGYWKLLS